MFTELLAVLSISAAAGFRLALPLLMIGLLSEDLWYQVPLLSKFPQSWLVGVLVSWTLAEILFSKEKIIQRLFQSVELFLSPGVGAIAGIAVARTFELDRNLIILLGCIGGIVAFLIHLIQVGWLYRLKQPSIGWIFAEDFLCVCLVLFAFDAPQQGGVIALLLVWLALRTSYAWQRWHVKGNQARDRRAPRPPDEG